jgi:hypothetical protein
MPPSASALDITDQGSLLGSLSALSAIGASRTAERLFGQIRDQPRTGMQRRLAARAGIEKGDELPDAASCAGCESRARFQARFHEPHDQQNIISKRAFDLGKWSPLTESNRRPSPYHGDALPTELRGHGGLRPARPALRDLGLTITAAARYASIHDRLPPAPSCLPIPLHQRRNHLSRRNR